jgi:ABC-type glycerol-3-phosphate transport system substrate-binding protein
MDLFGIERGSNMALDFSPERFGSKADPSAEYKSYEEIIAEAERLEQVKSDAKYIAREIIKELDKREAAKETTETIPETIPAETIAVVEVPVFEGKDNAVIQQGASLFATSTVSPEQQYASYEFIKFLTSTENTAKFATSTGYLPVRKSAQDLDMVKALIEDETNLYGQIYKVAQESLEYSYYSPAINNAQSARTSVEEKYSGFVTNGSADIEAFVKELLTEVETSISRQ